MSLPKRLAIYYAWPSVVNGSSSISGAVDVFNDYHMVVFGSGLEETSHPDHQKTKNIISHQSMAGTEVYGYIDSTISTVNFQQKVNKWKNMGVNGVFCDRFGYDFNVTRSKQNSILDYVHSKNLIAFVHAWDPDDVFSTTTNPTMNPLGTPSNISSSDWYIASSYQIINGDYQVVSDWQTKADKMANYKQSLGTKMACITTYDSRPYEQSKADYSYFSTVLYGFDAWGWGEELYSAQSAQLPFRPRKEFYGTTYKSGIVVNNGIYERNTNIGIQVDTANHTTNVLTT